jgi:Lrp/AsnC family leucine-responsive transcriptional regulator
MAGRLDRIDLKMLRLLQNNGRLSNAELAEMVGVSAATCHRRTQRLFDEGFVPEVRAVVAPRKVGKGALVMVGVVLDRSTPESFASFEQAIAKLKFVLDCHLVAGDFDYFLKIRVGDMEDFNRIHGEQLDRTSGRAPDANVLRDEGSGRQRAAGFLRGGELAAFTRLISSRSRSARSRSSAGNQQRKRPGAAGDSRPSSNRVWHRCRLLGTPTLLSEENRAARRS